jgi:hypothetical protein
MLNSEVIDNIRLILDFAIVPGIVVLFKLYQAVRNLELAMYKKFVTQEQMNTKFAEHERTIDLKLSLQRGGLREIQHE